MLNYSVPTFLKWAGGKSKVLRQLDCYLPSEIKAYHEPFLGGGAVFFYIKKKYNPAKVFLSDNNEELINCFREGQQNPSGLKELLQNHKDKHSKEYYYRVRDEIELEKLSDTERAARTIYLNKTCFNGLYRVNSKGKFNVPIGRYSNPKILDKNAIDEANRLLQGTHLECMSFEEAVKYVSKGGFIYFDPPYYPLSRTAYFTSYTKNLFLEEEQERLARLYKKLDKKGCLLMLSNSDTDFINNLYKDFHIIKVRAIRAISSNSKTRGAISELLILNYE